MKVLVCGSRHFNDYATLHREFEAIRGIPEIIEGEARGADRLAAEWAERKGISVRRFPANWDLHGKAAGAIRNTQMLEEGKPDLVVAFWDGESRGTKHMIDIAQKAGVSAIVVDI